MEAQISKVLDLCANIGRLLLENGAEVYRVEDTIFRIATHYGFKHVHVFSTPNTIIFTVVTDDGKEHTRLQRVFEQGANLDKVRAANQLSRAITAGDLTIDEAYRELNNIWNSKPVYSFPFHIFVAAFACIFFTIMFGGILQEGYIAFFAGGIGYFIFSKLSQMTNVKFFSYMVGAFVAGLFAIWIHNYVMPINYDVVIIASIMPLVPGRAITNGIRDLMASDYFSGLSIIADAILTSTAISVGVAGVLALI